MNKPNFVVILTDDQGYGDLSCMGGTDFKTPNIDRLAKSGARFTNWYSNSPVCSPSRASLLTGRYPGNAGVRSILKGHRKATGLLPEVPTIASELKKLGYNTGLSGKWHLGVEENSRPDKHGFDRWMGFLAGCIDYYSHIFYWGQKGGVTPVHDLWKDGKEFYQNGKYFTEMITDYSVDFIREQSAKDQPFFLYAAYNAPHYPMHAPKKYMDRFKDLPWDKRVMAAMLSAVDDGVGDILNELERNNTLDNTFIFFQSDNGPSREIRNWLDGTKDPYYGGTAGKLKGHKFSLYEGGIRVPGIISWPDQIPGSQVLDQPCAAMDIFPTILKAAGGNIENYEFDGKDIMPMVKDNADSPHDEIYWEMYDQNAVRRGQWKLVLNGRLVEGAPVEDEVHLSNLKEDMGEKANLKDEYPELTRELTESVKQWREKINKRWENEWNKKINGTT